MIYIERDECVACGTCRAICTFDAIELVEGRFRVVEESCCGCGICAARCPVGAIKVKKDVKRHVK